MAPIVPSVKISLFCSEIQGEQEGGSGGDGGQQQCQKHIIQACGGRGTHLVSTAMSLCDLLCWSSRKEGKHFKELSTWA